MGSGKRKETLFDDSDDESDGGVQLTVNDEYARRFEHNKKREEQHRLEEKSKPHVPAGNADNDSDSDSSSDDETEDEDGMLDTPELDAQWSKTLQAIRNKDPRIYDGKTSFYAPKEGEAAEEQEQEVPKAKKEKPIFLKDYHRERILAGDTGADQEPEPSRTYAEEQGDLQQSIRDEIKAQLQGDAGVDSDNDDDDGFIKAKEGAVAKARAELNEDGIHPSRSKKHKTTKIGVEDAHKDPELFLSNFLSSRAWIEEGKSKWEAFESDDDDGAAEQADQWEVAYNLRFEDPSKSNEVLRSYARDVAAAKSVRREAKTGRARVRELEKEKKEAEKQQRREERARLRKLKVEDAERKLKQIKKAAGLSGRAIKDEEWIKFLDDAWEDDKWEEAMAKTFGEQYYAEEDGKLGGKESEDESEVKKKVKKPKWDDDIDIKDLVPEFEDEEPAKLAPSDEDAEEAEVEGGDAEEEDDDEDDEDGPSAKRQKTTKDRKKERLLSQKAARQERSKIEALVDAKLDIEQPEALAGQSRFAYRETWAESYGLTARDILMAPSDAALNEFVGLKKLAHFRPADKKSKDKKRLGKKARLRQWRRETFGPEAEKDGPAFAFGGGAPGDLEKQAADAEASNMAESGSKKKRKRSGRKGKGAAA